MSSSALDLRRRTARRRRDTDARRNRCLRRALRRRGAPRVRGRVAGADRRARRHRRRRRRRARRRRPDGAHDARAGAARRLSRPARARADGARRARRAIVHAATVAQTWDGAAAARPVAHAARARYGASRWRATHGTGTVVIRRSHHIACLAAYLKRATDRGAMALIHCSDPSSAQRRAVRRASRRCSRRIRSRRAFRRRGDPILLDMSRELHHQRLDEPAAQGGRDARASVGAGRAGQRHRAIPACCSTSRRERCCRSAGSKPATRASGSRC